MKWSPQAEQAVQKVPFFVRKRVRRRVEEYAFQEGASQVELEHVLACQRRFLERMEEEVRGYQVETCFGPTGCPNRAVVAEDMASKLERLLQDKGIREFLARKVGGPLKLHHEFRISLSDCPNSCSRPQIADVGLVGCTKPLVSLTACEGCQACVQVCKEQAIQLDSRGPVLDPHGCLGCGQCIKACPSGTLQEGPTGYRILVGGKLGRHPRLATEVPGVHPVGGIPQMVERIVDLYMKESRGGERLGEIVERKGWQGFLDELLKGQV
ncbi:MAG: 4Fe-4S dicluster domain-containing protein [bacterium]